MKSWFLKLRHVLLLLPLVFIGLAGAPWAQPRPIEFDQFRSRVNDAVRALGNHRDRKDGEPIAYYDEHGLNQQRAFQIVCYMVGADPIRFKDLAAETKLPKDRQQSCAEDYRDAAKSWGVVLQPHLRAPGQQETKIDVVYGEASGRLEISAQVARSIKLLE